MNKRITRRGFLKLTGIGSISVFVVSCFPSGKNTSTEIPNPTFEVDMFSLYPDQNLFTSENLFGNIIKVEDVSLEELQKYERGMEFALVQEGINTADPNLDTEVFALRMTDDAETVRENVFMIRQPKLLEGLGLNEQSKSALYFYSGIDGISFVSPNEAPDKTIGRLFPVVYEINQASQTLYAGLGKQTQPDKYTIGLFDLGMVTGDIRYRDPYSGREVELLGNDVPNGMKKSFALLVPVEVSKEFMEISKKFKDTDYTLKPDGTIELKMEDGTLKAVEGLKINPKDGSITLAYSGEDELYKDKTFKIDAETIKIDKDTNILTFAEPKEDGGMIWMHNPALITRGLNPMRPEISFDKDLDGLFDMGDIGNFTTANFVARIHQLEKSGKFQPKLTGDEIPFEKFTVYVKGEENTPVSPDRVASDDTIWVFDVDKPVGYFSSRKNKAQQVVATWKATCYDGQIKLIVSLARWLNKGGEISYTMHVNPYIKEDKEVATGIFNEVGRDREAVIGYRVLTEKAYRRLAERRDIDPSEFLSYIKYAKLFKLSPNFLDGLNNGYVSNSDGVPLGYGMRINF